MNKEEARTSVDTGDVCKDYVPKTDDEIKTIALGLVDGSLFTDRHIRSQDREQMMQMVFMPLIFLSETDVKHMVDNEADMLYSEMSEAMPTAINGYPCFGSFRWLNRSDTAKVLDKYQKIKAAMDAA
jgi:hypothetical protein